MTQVYVSNFLSVYCLPSGSSVRSRNTVVCAQRLTTRKPPTVKKFPSTERPRPVNLVSLTPLRKEEGLERNLAQQLTEKWESLPPRFQIVGFCCAAFFLCNMDKVNLSIAIIPMASEYNWPGSVAGLVQSSFFWGYMLSQIPGGYLCARLGGRRVLPYAVGLWTLAVSTIPFTGGTVPGLCLARASVGLAEAITPSAITDMVSRTIPKSERSRTMSFIFAGLSAGSILGLFLAPFLIERFEWESVFLSFAIGSALWILFFERLMSGFLVKDPSISQQLTVKRLGTTRNEGGVVPIRGILRSTPFWALAFTHFCGNYFHYTMLTWLPSYLTQTLNLDLRQAAFVSLGPPISSIIFAAVAGSTADKLVSLGWELTHVRKLCQTIAFLGPSSCLIGASLSENPTVSAGFVTLSIGLAAFSMAGLYCNHQDLSPKYSSFLLGLTNTVASIPGIVGVWLTGYIMDRFDSWELALFFPSILFFVSGFFVFLKFGSAEQQSFSDNKPFAFEKLIQKQMRRKL